MKSILLILSMSVLVACNKGGGGGGAAAPGGTSGGGGGGGAITGSISQTLVRTLDSSDSSLTATMGSYLGKGSQGYYYANGTIPYIDLGATMTGGAGYTTRAMLSYTVAPTINRYRTYVSGTTISVLSRMPVMSETLITADRSWPTGFEEIDVIPFNGKYAIYGRILAADAVSGLDEYYIILSDHGAVEIEMIPWVPASGSVPSAIDRFKAGLYVTGTTLIYTTASGKIMSLDSTLTPVQLMNNTWVAGKLHGTGNVFRAIANTDGSTNYTQVYEFTLTGGVLNKSPVGSPITLFVDGTSIHNSVPDIGYWDETYIMYQDASNVFHLSSDYQNDILTSSYRFNPALVGDIGNFKYYQMDTSSGNYLVRFDKTLKTSQVITMPTRTWAGGYNGAVFIQGGEAYFWLVDYNVGQSNYLFKTNSAFTTQTLLWTSPTYTGSVWDSLVVNDNIMVVVDVDSGTSTYKLHAFAWNGTAVVESLDFFTMPVGVTNYERLTMRPDGAFVLSLTEGPNSVSYEVMMDFIP